MCRIKIVLSIIIIMAAGILTPSARGVSADFDNNSIVNINDLAIYTAHWLLYTNEPEDLDGSGFVDFKDYSILATDWMKNYCDDLNSPDPGVFGNWQSIGFTNIGPCGQYDCWYDEIVSDPCYDRCSSKLYVACQETPEFDYYCAYNFWCNNTRVGLCVYNCGRNYFWILKNNAGCRITATRHIARDIPPQDPECYPWGCDDCDEGTIGYYNWQVVFTTVVNGQKAGWCKQDLTFDTNINYGQPGPCKITWW
ncbi:MAG: hypothetical protein ABR969_10955 [Sedimentisphaerales bacterium]